MYNDQNLAPDPVTFPNAVSGMSSDFEKNKNFFEMLMV